MGLLAGSGVGFDGKAFRAAARAYAGGGQWNQQQPIELKVDAGGEKKTLRRLLQRVTVSQRTSSPEFYALE